MKSYLQQSSFSIRCEWGIQGVQHLAPISDVLIIVDVLSFSTCVDIACSRGAAVFPYQWKDSSARLYAREHHALMATSRSNQKGHYSLSPFSLTQLPSKSKLVLPSPNGSSLSFLAKGTPHVLCGCLRNAKAIAHSALEMGWNIAIVPAGERWPNDSLRPALEDLIGAGAIAYYLSKSGKTMSPETQAAISIFQAHQKSLHYGLACTVSGKELIQRGYSVDIDLASALNESTSVPKLAGKSYVDVSK